MAMFWKDAGWRCRTHRPIHHADLVGLIHLYQPIVGASAISLYMTLACQVPLHRAGVSKLYAHSYLLQLCSFTFDQLLEARHLLEGVGLINTYEIEEEEDHVYYEYEMLPPLTPAKFFQSDILSVTLYNALGKERYIAVKDWLTGDDRFQPGRKEEKKKNITRSFQDVFDSISPAELAKQAEREKEMTGPVAKIDESLHQGKRPDFKQDIDFSILELRLSHLLGKDVWTEDLKQEIRELGFLYQLDEWAILKALQNPYVTSHGQIRLDRLRSFVRSEYCMQFGSTPVVAKKADAEQAKEEKKMPTDPDKPLSEEEKHIRQLAQISPMQLLAFYQKGGRIPASDVEIVESLIRHYGLPPGVVNVLLEYVLLKYDYKLPRNLVEKIAGHWKRLGISTVEEAVEQAKKEEWETKRKKQQPRSFHPKSPRNKPEALPRTLQMQMEQSKRSKSEQEAKDEWADQQEQIRAKLRLMNERFVAGNKEKKNTP
jgi:replication initiation and membrane attachment protein